MIYAHNYGIFNYVLKTENNNQSCQFPNSSDISTQLYNFNILCVDYFIN
jgi:hypothetical protein